MRAWPGYGDFLQTLARWLMGSDVPPGLALRPRVDGSELGLDLLYDESWDARLAASAPQILVADGATGKARPLVWERLEPGHFRASTPLAPGQWVRGAAQVGKYSLPFGPVAVGMDPEWLFDRQRVAELQNVARLSGGGERIDLSKIWQAPRQQEFSDVRPWLLAALLLAFVTEVLCTRLGWQIPARVTWRSWRRAPRVRASTKTVVAPVIPTPPPRQPQVNTGEARANRFRKAKAQRKTDHNPQL